MAKTTATLEVFFAETFKTINLSKFFYSVGRDSTCCLPFTGDRSISKIHFCLVRKENTYILIDGRIDLDAPSFNGVFVNGQRVIISKTLEHEDEIKIGLNCRMHFKLTNTAIDIDPNDTAY